MRRGERIAVLQGRRLARVVALAVAAAGIAVTGAAAAGGGAHAVGAWSTTTVATGLDSPRGLAITPQGRLLVAEAGHGGDVCVPAGPLGQQCVGATSGIASVDPGSGSSTTLVGGLFSESITLEGTTGVDGVSALGGKVLAVMTGAPQQLANLTCTNEPPDCGAVLQAARAQAGQLLDVSAGGTWRAVAGIGAKSYDLLAAHPELGDPLDGPNGNPYGVLARPRGAWVADAGGNFLDWVSGDGSIDVASHLADPAPGSFPGDAVPTCVAMLRGNLYAADLAGRLWRRGGAFVPKEVPVVDASGQPLLRHVTGCVSDGLDHLYLVNMWGTPGPPIPAGPESAAGTGSVVEVDAGGGARELAGGLVFPNGIALAKDGSLYVSVGSTCTAQDTPFPYCARGGSIVHLQP